MFSLCETKKINWTGRKKKTLHFRCANVRGLCGSIPRKLLFYSSASSRPKFVLLFRAQCGKAFSLSKPATVTVFFVLFFVHELNVEMHVNVKGTQCLFAPASLCQKPWSLCCDDSTYEVLVHQHPQHLVGVFVGVPQCFTEGASQRATDR